MSNIWKKNLLNKCLVLLNKANSLLKKGDDPDNLKGIKILKLKGKCFTTSGRYDDAIITYVKLNSYGEDTRNYLKIGVYHYVKKN